MTDNLPKIEQLTLGRWNTWNTEISAWLRIKGWFAVVSGSTTQPPAPTGDAAPFQAYKDWLEVDSRSAGALILSIAPEERRIVEDVQDSGSAIYAALKARHVQEKASSRFNLYDDFFSIRLNEGEKLGDMAGRIRDAMRRIQERRPRVFTLQELDEELIIMGIIRGLSQDASCRVLC